MFTNKNIVGNKGRYCIDRKFTDCHLKYIMDRVGPLSLAFGHQRPLLTNCRF